MLATFKPAAGGYLQIGGILRCRRAGENLSVIVVVVKFFSGLDSASGDIRKIIGRQWWTICDGVPEGHRPVIVRYRAIPFRCPSDSRAIIDRYHTIVRGLAGISPGSLRVPRGIRQEPGRYPAETYARCMTKLVNKCQKTHRNVKYVYNFDELRALETRQTPAGLLLYIRGR